VAGREGASGGEGAGSPLSSHLAIVLLVIVFTLLSTATFFSLCIAALVRVRPIVAFGFGFLGAVLLFSAEWLPVIRYFEPGFLVMYTLAIAPLSLPFAALSTFTSIDRRTTLGWSVFCALAVFAIAVTLPYHFGGYRELAESCAINRTSACSHTKGFGLTKYYFPGMYSYVLTFKEFGYPFLGINGLIALGASFSRHGAIDYIARAILAAFAVYSVYAFESYSIINRVLE
jgi:hypothetical protein